MGVGWTERNALRSGVEILPCGRGTCRRDMALQHWHPALSLPCTLCLCQCRASNSSTAGSGFTPFLKANKHSVACCISWGAPGQAGVILPWTQHAASPELAWVLQVAPAVFPMLSLGSSSVLHPSGRRSQPSTPIAGSFRASTLLTGG